MEIGPAIRIAWKIGEADDIAAIVNSVRSVPGCSTQISQIGNGAVPPDNRMLGAEPSNCLIAGTGNADYVSVVIDRDCGSVRIVSERRKLFLNFSIRSPDHCFELKNLMSAIASRIMNVVLRPADDLACIVSACGESIVSSQSRKRAHDAEFPRESYACVSCVRWKEE